MAEPNITIIKKKKVSGGGGHHGGAWKVAYADFVTAMMAFFLLMWLLNATTEKQRKGLADYFSPTIPLHRTSGGGSGPFSGQTVFAQVQLPQNGRGSTDQNPSEDVQSKGDTGLADMTETVAEPEPQRGRDTAESDTEEDFLMLEGMLAANSGETDSQNRLMQHVITRVTDEGLVIELFDREGAPLFEPGTDTPTETLLALLEVIARVGSTVKNSVAISGHAFLPVDGRGANPNWQVSTNRAQRVLRELVGGEYPADQIARVTGLADRKPAVDDLTSPRNNRIEVILLR